MTEVVNKHDPGGKVRLQLPEGVIGSARFSECGRYRQLLIRDWTPEGAKPRAICFIGMNPSVADAEASDPTCHRELMFARDWGYTRYLKGNVLDWRATSPRDIPHETDIACSAENVPALVEMAREAEIVVMAFGKLHKRYNEILNTTIEAITAMDKPLKCFGFNKDGSAKHPLYLRKDSRLISYL